MHRYRIYLITGITLTSIYIYVCLCLYIYRRHFANGVSGLITVYQIAMNYCELTERGKETQGINETDRLTEKVY